MKKIRILTNLITSRRTASPLGYQDLGMVLLFIFLLPYVVSFFFGVSGAEDVGQESTKYAVMVDDIGSEDGIIVSNKTRAGVEKMPLEVYITSYLPTTIPSDYEMEALKAQAIVLRTELIKSYYDSQKGETGTGESLVYRETEIGTVNEEAYARASEAVAATKGMYLTYEGSPIYAPYFFVSGGSTRNGNEVFEKEEYPYLKAVGCPRDFSSEEYSASLKWKAAAFRVRLKELYPEVDWERFVGNLILERDRAGYVTNVVVGDISIKGEVFRADFLLNSSCFEVEQSEKYIRIKTKGVGHGLGFGQFAANATAKEGSDFINILQYFFSGVEIEKFE